MLKIFVCILLLLPTLSFAQNRFLYLKVDSLLYYVGGGYSKNTFIELGVASAGKRIGNKSKLITCANFEFHFQKPLLTVVKSKVLLTKVAGPFGCAANLIHYGLFAEDWSLALAPEVGFAIGRLRAFYNYNVIVIHSDFDRVSKSVFGLNLWFGKAKV